ncbi:metallophosphoesterase [Candidatus Bipolaricaulota bacterium]
MNMKKEGVMGNHTKCTLLGIGLTICLCFVSGTASAETAKGVVFFDANENGVLDLEDSGAPNVPVSDGASIVWTDAEGGFELLVDAAARFVFVSTPSTGRAVGDWYVPIAADADYSFPLERISDDGSLVFVQLSDLHYAPNPDEFKLGLRDRRMQILPGPVLEAIYQDVNAFDADFVVLAGDIVADAKYPEPEVVDRWMRTVAANLSTGFDAPLYGVIGNHDVVRDETIGKTFYEDAFGPPYYSFDRKGTHCVVLDTQQLEGTSLIYTIDARQLSWLEQDLSSLSAQTPIIVFCHEPTFDWADTPENQALFTLLQGTGISALLNGHWHTNAILREEPFLEMTSAAVCGAWWEGPGPDGTGFGYRVFQFSRGNLDSTWRTGGEDAGEVSEPSRAVLTWVDQLQASVWGSATQALYRWDEGEEISVGVNWNGLWSSISSNLNVSTLPDGYHDLAIEFTMADSRVIEETRSYNISNPIVPLGEIFDHESTYQGKIVAAPELEVRAVMGSDISAFDETKTIIISKFPYDVVRNDMIGIVGMYRPTGAAPIKAYDSVFLILRAE